MERRLVLEHSDGNLIGMCMIIGREADIGVMTDPKNVPTIINLTIDGRRTACHFVRQTDTYVLYKEQTIQ